MEQRQHEQTKNELGLVTSELSDTRSQLKSVIVENEGKRLEIERLQAELPALTESQALLHEQVESLQALWIHKQKDSEIAEEKNKSLQKLNQALSLNLNSQRKEISDLQNQIEQVTFEKDDKIKTLIAEIQMLRRQLIED